MPFAAIKYPAQQKKKGTASLAAPCATKNTTMLSMGATVNTWINITQTAAAYLAMSSPGSAYLIGSPLLSTIESVDCCNNPHHHQGNATEPYYCVYAKPSAQRHGRAQ